MRIYLTVAVTVSDHHLAKFRAKRARAGRMELDPIEETMNAVEQSLKHNELFTNILVTRDEK
jgi:hypothetical protein